ncbi:hypothetical protein [Microvirga sp. TS319]|uniref:hypothetical protein n=1 Tax=Microvirga sp. TS319 TaxID=3241165 RepID=UPI00351A3C29
MAKNTTLAWASFPTRDEAEQARQRLEENGFAHNSIGIDRRQDGTFAVEVHTREENLPRVEKLLHTSAPMYAARQFSSNVIETVTSNPLVMMGSAALAGLVLYSLLPRNRRPTVHSIREIPSRMRDTVRELPDTMRDTARTVQETVRDLPGTVSDTVSSLTGGGNQSQQPQEPGAKKPTGRG